jgi:hypothetical protein
MKKRVKGSQMLKKKSASITMYLNSMSFNSDFFGQIELDVRLKSLVNTKKGIERMNNFGKILRDCPIVKITVEGNYIYKTKKNPKRKIKC